MDFTFSAKRMSQELQLFVSCLCKAVLDTEFQNLRVHVNNKNSGTYYFKGQSSYSGQTFKFCVNL